jgi:peptide/nickel transport system substrate-binding protein
VLLSALVAGCGSSSSSSGQQVTSPIVTTTPAGTKQVSKVTWDLPYGEPVGLDWLSSVGYSESTAQSNMCESLTQLRPDGSYGPGLATSVTQPDPLTLVYHLRHGVHFWDGKPMTVADAVYSLQRTANRQGVSVWTHPSFDYVKSIDPGPGFALTIHLTKPDYLLPEILATAAGTVAEKAYVEAKGNSYGTAKGGVMCTGPFMFKSWTPGSDIIEVRNPNYWDSSHIPKVGEIDFKFLTDPSTLTNALLSGSIDGTYEAPIGAVKQLQNSSVGTFYQGKSTEWASVGPTLRKGPIQDPRIREAISLAIDYQAIGKTIFHGTGYPAKALGPPTLWSYARPTFAKGYAQLPPTTMNLSKAKQLVKEAGSPTQEMSIVTSADDEADTQMATLIQAAATSIGLHTKIVTLPAAQMIAISYDPKRSAQYDMVVSASGYSDVPDPLELTSFVFLTHGPFNVTGYSNPQVDSLLAQARQTSDPTQRAELINQAQYQIYAKDFALTTLVSYSERLFMNKRISGAVASLPSELYYPWAIDLGGK